jgi:hypothetical protein
LNFIIDSCLTSVFLTEFEMSDLRFGLDKPDQESASQAIGVQSLPLAPSPTSQQVNF